MNFWSINIWILETRERTLTQADTQRVLIGICQIQRALNVRKPHFLLSTGGPWCMTTVIGSSKSSFFHSEIWQCLILSLFWWQYSYSHLCPVSHAGPFTAIVLALKTACSDCVIFRRTLGLSVSSKLLSTHLPQPPITRLRDPTYVLPCCLSPNSSSFSLLTLHSWVPPLPPSPVRDKSLEPRHHHSVTWLWAGTSPCFPGLAWTG